MKKRNKVKQDKLHKITTKRALYEKARKKKRVIKTVPKVNQIEMTNKDRL